MPMTDISTVLDTIIGGQVDDHLDAIATAARERATTKARSKFLMAKKGDRGHLINGNPKYLNGAPFTVVEKKQTRLVVKIDQAWLDAHPQATRWAGNITCPPELLEFD